MQTHISSPAHLSDSELLARLKFMAQRERHATAGLVALLSEADERRLFLQEGCSSLFTYCTQILHLSEHAAYGRIEAARAVRQFPVILERLRDGSVHLTAIGLLRAHLTQENHEQLLDRARHKSKREVEELIASLRPLPSVPAIIRKLPGKLVAPIEMKTLPLPVEQPEKRSPAPSIAQEMEPRPGRRSWRRFLRSATRSSSRPVPRRAGRCASCRSSYVTRFPTEIRRRSSIWP